MLISTGVVAEDGREYGSIHGIRSRAGRQLRTHVLLSCRRLPATVALAPADSS